MHSILPPAATLVGRHRTSAAAIARRRDGGKRLVLKARTEDVQEDARLATAEPVAPPARQFGRFRPPPPVESTVPGADAEGGDEFVVLPFDSTKTFVGPNGTYYDERWRWMEWRGDNRSWNWAAALSFGGWLAYRRLYGALALHLGWLGLLLILAVNGVPVTLLAVLQLLVAASIGTYGNLIYRQYFRRVAFRVARDYREHDARLAALAAAGGTDHRAVLGMVAALIGIAVAVLGAMRLAGAPIELDWW